MAKKTPEQRQLDYEIYDLLPVNVRHWLMHQSAGIDATEFVTMLERHKKKFVWLTDDELIETLMRFCDRVATQSHQVVMSKSGAHHGK